MARKAAKEAAKKKAAKQKKMLIVLGVLLVVALVFAVSTLSKLGKHPAAASPGTTTPGSLPTETPVNVLPGIAPPPTGSLRAFTAFGRKDPFDNGGPSQNTQATPTPTIADAVTPTPTTSGNGAKKKQQAKRNSTRKGG